MEGDDRAASRSVTAGEEGGKTNGAAGGRQIHPSLSQSVQDTEKGRGLDTEKVLGEVKGEPESGAGGGQTAEVLAAHKEPLRAAAEPLAS